MFPETKEYNMREISVFIETNSKLRPAKDDATKTDL
jgi:hypothetical protein